MIYKVVPPVAARRSRCLRSLAAGLAVSTALLSMAPAYAQTRPVDHMVAHCEASGGRFVGGVCHPPPAADNRQVEDRSSSGGAGLGEIFGVVVLGVIACAAAGCFDEDEEHK